MQFLKGYLGLQKSIILSGARIINCIGSFVYPFLSLLLTLKLGFSKSDAGLITTISVTLGGVGLLFGGKLADRFGRKKIIIILSTLSAACFCGLRVSGNFKNYCIFDNCSYFFSVGVIPAINSMVADITDQENRKNAYSLIYCHQCRDCHRATN